MPTASLASGYSGQRPRACILDYDKEQNELLFSYSPKADVNLTMGQLRAKVARDEKVLFWRSGKWTESQMVRIATAAGSNINHVWKDSKQEYCE